MDCLVHTDTSAYILPPYRELAFGFGPVSTEGSGYMTIFRNASQHAYTPFLLLDLDFLVAGFTFGFADLGSALGL